MTCNLILGGQHSVLEPYNLVFKESHIQNILFKYSKNWIQKHSLLSLKGHLNHN